jgi:hypothetical protein
MNNDLLVYFTLITDVTVYSDVTVYNDVTVCGDVTLFYDVTSIDDSILCIFNINIEYINSFVIPEKHFANWKMKNGERRVKNEIF